MREVNLVRFLSLLLNNLSVLSRKYGLVHYFLVSSMYLGVVAWAL